MGTIVDVFTRLVGRVAFFIMVSILFAAGLGSAASGDHNNSSNQLPRARAAAEITRNDALEQHLSAESPTSTPALARAQMSKAAMNVNSSWAQTSSSPEASGPSSSDIKVGMQQQQSRIQAEGTNYAGPFTAGSWQYAHATFYGDESAQDTMQGACGFQNLWHQGYGAATTALSTTLFEGGFACGRCFEVRCVGSWACYPGNPSTKVTATNFCPPNWARPTNNGGWCNPPRQHMDMAKPAFEKIAYWRAGIVPIAYRRIACTKQGNMEFSIAGNQWWHIVFITNVGGPGDIGQVFVRGSNTNQWIPMTHNWGTGFQIFRNFLGESLSFMVVSNSNYETVVSWNTMPSNWQFGQTYIGGQFQRSY